jgi:hypothetical protein
MGLVKAACASWSSSDQAPLPSMSGKDKLHQEYVARRKDLGVLGLQAMESEEKLVFAAVPNPAAVHSPDALVWPRGTCGTFASAPRTASGRTQVYTLESFLIDASCCETKGSILFVDSRPASCALPLNS